MTSKIPEGAESISVVSDGTEIRSIPIQSSMAMMDGEDMMKNEGMMDDTSRCLSRRSC